MRLVAERVRGLREISRLSYTDLADELGVKDTFIHKIEAGSRSVSRGKAEDLAALFGTTLDYLRGDQD